MKIAIIAAMEKECSQLRKFFCNSNVQIFKCGIGKVSAALKTQEIIRSFHPDAIISSGCAGGNGDEINLKDVVVSSQLAYHDVYCGCALGNEIQFGQVQGMPPRYNADPQMLKIAQNLSLSNTNTHIHSGLIVTGDWFVDSKEKIQSILGNFPEAKAVDMESCAIAQTCYMNKTPFISFRIISDIPLKDSNASQYHNFWETLADESFEVTRTFIEDLLLLNFKS